jgi:hypothetical protein
LYERVDLQAFSDTGRVGTSNYYHWYEYDVMGNLTSVYSGNTSSKPSTPEVTYTYTPAGGKASKVWITVNVDAV